MQHINAQNSLSAQLAGINLSQENILKISKAYLEAITTNKSNVSVDILMSDGSSQTINIPSNIFLGNEFRRLNDSFKNLVGLTEDGKARLIASDGTFREILLSSFLTAFRPLYSDIEVSGNINVSNNSIIENLVSPLTSLEIKLSSSFSAISSSFVTKIVTDDLNGIENGMSFGEVVRLLSNRSQKFEINEFEQPIINRKTRFFGRFEILDYIISDEDIFTITTNNIRYSDEENLFLGTRILANGDKITNSDGTILMEIISVNEDALKFTCNIIGGVGTIEKFTEFHFRDSIQDGVGIRVPVRLNEKSIIFVSVVDKSTNIGSAKSEAIVFDSNSFQVQQNGVASPFNEYFSAKVADIGRYIESMVRENNIPATLGETPTKPIMNSNDFNVVQINKHLTNTPEVEKLKKMEKEKSLTQNRIEILTTAINELNEKISQGNYNSNAKLQSDRTKRDEYTSEKIKLSTLLGSLVSDMKTQIGNVSEQSITPKYRVRGFWDVQKPLVSDLTDPQYIVQYEIRYRYVSNTGNTANSGEMIYTQGDNQLNAVFSAWNWKKTQPLERYLDSDGIYRWKNNNPSDSDNESINQLDIPINYGESVEFQIRSISEAGYPTAPLTSEWSDLNRVNFPQELLQESDVAQIMRRNTADELQVAVNREFATQGITKHIANSFQEQDRYFAHLASEIGSGKVTNEQKQISVAELIDSLNNEIKSLKEKVDRRYASATIQIVDDNLVEHDINNFSTINLFAGNYSDDIDLSDSSNFGAIIEKEFKLKILNRNQQTIEMLSISPGVLNQTVPNAKYNNIPLHVTGSNTTELQRKGQILYLRNMNVDGTKQLYVQNNNVLSTIVPNSDIDPNGFDAAKNVVNFNGTTAELITLTSNADLSNYVALTKDHHAYLDFLSTGNTSIMNEALNRAKYFSDSFKMDYIQDEASPNVIVNYISDDKHLVGNNTCGACLFLSPNAIESFQVDGIDTSSAKEIYTGEEDAIIIPLKFQYRMTDAIGNPNGLSSLNLSTNFEYKKKIGFDLLINNKLFSFDINVSARFRSSAVTNNIIGNTISSSNNQLTQPNIQ